jgi:hypothetical protein
MFKCWSCGTEHELPAPIGANHRDIKAEYSQGYLDGYSDAEKHYTNRCILCGTGGITSPSLCISCKEENPHWMGE